MRAPAVDRVRLPDSSRVKPNDVEAGRNGFIDSIVDSGRDKFDSGRSRPSRVDENGAEAALGGRMLDEGDSDEVIGRVSPINWHAHIAAHVRFVETGTPADGLPKEWLQVLGDRDAEPRDRVAAKVVSVGRADAGARTKGERHGCDQSRGGNPNPPVPLESHSHD